MSMPEDDTHHRRSTDARPQLNCTRYEPFAVVNPPDPPSFILHQPFEMILNLRLQTADIFSTPAMP